MRFFRIPGRVTATLFHLAHYAHARFHISIMPPRREASVLEQLGQKQEERKKQVATASFSASDHAILKDKTGFQAQGRLAEHVMVCYSVPDTAPSYHQ